MTYLIENETAALLIPVRFLGKLHPHFREVMQLLVIQPADEARHIEVFTWRARIRRRELGLSTASGQASLATCSTSAVRSRRDAARRARRGSFLSLLWFVRDHAPDACTREVARLAAQDEARRVAFGLGHLAHQLAADPPRSSAAIPRSPTPPGRNEEVFDALVVLAAGGWEPSAVGQDPRACQIPRVALRPCRQTPRN